MNIAALPYVMLLAFFFGSSLVVSRFGMGQFDPSTYIGIRMILSSGMLALLVYAVATGRRLPRDPEALETRRAAGHFWHRPAHDLRHQLAAIPIERRHIIAAWRPARL